MAESSLLISLPQMVDLALGSPEVGAVNFNVLHSVLHVLIQQVRLTECTVEFRGNDCQRVTTLISTVNTGPTLKLTEYHINEDNKPPKSHRKSSAVEQEINVINPTDATESSTNRAFTKKLGSKVVLIEPATRRMPTMTMAVSEERFHKFEHELANINSKITEIMEMPTNLGLIDAIRNVGGEEDTHHPAVETWNLLNLSRRVDATEQYMNKLSTMMEDLVRDITEAGGAGLVQKMVEMGVGSAASPPEDSGQRRGSVFADIANRFEAIEAKIVELESRDGDERRGSTGSNADTPEPPKDDAGLRKELDVLKKNLKNLEAECGNVSKGFKDRDIAELLKDIDYMKSRIDAMGDVNQQDAFTDMEGKIGDYVLKMNNMDQSFSLQINSLQENLLKMEEELGALLERVNTSLPSGDMEGQSLADFFNKLVKLQEDLEQLTTATNKLTDEQEERQLTIDAVVEQMELLKTTKADREDLEDALADKADTQAMNRKVSHDQFDAACDDLTRGLEETVNKLTQQEQLWQNTLENMQLTIGAKLDKQEFDPLREFVSRKIKSLQERLKILLAMKNEQEAAGTKSKILRNVNCISCDKDVIMQKQNQFSTLPQPPQLPGTRSMRPYIAYELDAVRKQQKSLPQSRNMNYLESAMHETKPTKEIKGLEKPIPASQHLCNRYCGGSHTMTAPGQRVAHVGHFLNQWGPQAMALDEGMLMGNDGRMYKAREGGGDIVSPRKDGRLSAAIQTEEPKEQVPRMSEQIESTRMSVTAQRRSSVRKSIISQGAKEEAVDKGDEVAGVGGERRRSSAARRGSRASQRRRSSSRKSGTAEQLQLGEGRRPSTASRKGSRKSADKTTLRRESTNETKRRASQKENTPPESEAAPAEGAQVEKSTSKISAKESEAPTEAPSESPAEAPPAEETAADAPPPPAED